MLSVIFPVFIFLGSVNKVYSPADHIHCEWFCTITAKSPQTAYEMEIWFNVSKRIDQKCVANTSYRNLQNTTTTGYVFVLLSRKERDYHDGFSFMPFDAMTALEHVFQTEQMNNKAMKNVSCLLQPMANGAEMTVSNGLNALNSLRFYISFDNQSWNIPFAGYVHLEENYIISAGFSNENVSEDYELTLTSVYHVLSLLIRIGYVIYFPLCLTLFCHTLKKIKIKNNNRREPENCRQRPTEEHYLGPSAGKHRSGEIETAAASQRVTNSGTESEMNDDVDVIDVDGPASPVGIRNFFSNKVFLNKANSNEKEWKKVCYRMVQFVVLIMFPLSILLWVDAFVFLIPRLFSQGFTNLPSPYLTKLVFTFVFKIEPGLFWFVFVYCGQMLYVCADPSSLTIKPSFIHRKHIVCFFKTLLIPTNQWSICDECKKIKALEVSSIPDKIQLYFQSFGWETLKRNWKDVYENPVKKSSSGNQEYLPVTFEDSSSTNQVRSFSFVRELLKSLQFIVVTFVDWVISQPIVSRCRGGCQYRSNCCGNKWVKALFLFVVKLLKLFLFLVVTFVDWVISQPIVSLCLGGCQFRSTGNYCGNKLAKALSLFVEFVLICSSIAYVAYISYCCSLSLQIAIESLFISGMKYPIETLSSVIICVLTWHYIWMLYSFFTNNYFGLLAKLFDICREHHRNEMKDYTIGYKMYIPKKLFGCACDKFEPVTENLKKLGLRLLLYTICLFFIFSFVYGTKYPKKVVLPAASTLLVVLHPVLWDFLRKRDEEKGPKNSSREEKLRNFAYAYFMGKIE